LAMNRAQEDPDSESTKPSFWINASQVFENKAINVFMNLGV